MMSIETVETEMIEAEGSVMCALWIIKYMVLTRNTRNNNNINWKE